MHYICKDCNNDFDYYPPIHPHIGPYYSPYGCPICRAQQAKGKVCPKCGSTNLIEKIGSQGDDKE